MLGWFSEASTFASRSKRATYLFMGVLQNLGLIHLTHAALANLGGDGVGAEGGVGLQRHQFTGTRALSSSNQLRTTVIAGEAPPPFDWPVSWITRNRPSGATS